jgi:Putative outer membrane beta-barrel porin, MtrB/PioB
MAPISSGDAMGKGGASVMIQKFTFTAAVLASLCLMPVVAFAQEKASDSSASPPSQPETTDPTSPSTAINEVTLGTQWVGGANTGQYGRYNGFTKQGFDILGGFIFSNRDQWDSGKTFYYNFEGINLNFQTGNRLAKHFSDSTYTDDTHNDLGPNSEINLSFGNQGSWGVTAGYDAISYTGNIINSIYTVKGTTGILNNNLAPWGGATNDPLHVGTTTSFTTTSLSPYEKQFQVGTRRDIFQVGGHYIIGDWTLTADIRHEHKEGTLEESLRENYGGIPFTLPIDYDTDRYDVSAAYNVSDLQAILQYTFSRFTSNDLAVTLPFAVSISALSANSGPYAQSALYALPPSTDAHYFTGMLGYNVMPKTRINLNGRFGLELQNSTFPANSADPNLSSILGNPTYTWFKNLNGLNQGTSATSPDMVATIYQGSAVVTSSPLDNLNGKVSYSFDGRNVRLNQYKVFIGGPSPDATANTAVYVVPQNWFKQTASAELGYVVLPENSTKVTASYAFNDTHRTNAQVDHSVTNTESVQVSSMFGSDIMGRITYEHGDRTGNVVYGRAWGNLESGSPEIEGTPSGAYYQAPMTSDSVVFRSDYAPLGNVSAGVFLKYVNEQFHYSSVPTSGTSGDWNLVGMGEGIKRDYNLTIGPDISYRPSQEVSLHLYYTYEQIFFNNFGNGACAESNTGACAGSAGYFRNTYTSSTQTAGVNAEWQATSALKLTADYNFAYGTVAFGEFNGVFVPSASVSQSYQNVIPYPDINSVMHDLQLTAYYQLTPRIECSLMYRYSMFHNNDWNDLTAPVQASTNTGTVISILTPGYSSPNYNVSTIGMAVKFAL